MSEEAYRKAMALKLAERQTEQRQMPPKKVAQRLLHEWSGKASGFGVLLDPFAAAKLVELVEAIVVAERAAADEAPPHFREMRGILKQSR
jgi:hypothetical protein